MPFAPPYSPNGLPSSPRANRNMLLSPLDTSFPSHDSPPSYSDAIEGRTPQSIVESRHRNRDSLIFVNATIPLSPTSSTSSSPIKEQSGYAGLIPRKRSALARLFCCFGREERARRRMERDTEYEKVGEDCHWTEY